MKRGNAAQIARGHFISAMTAPLRQQQLFRRARAIIRDAAFMALLTSSNLIINYTTQGVDIIMPPAMTTKPPRGRLARILHYYLR